MTKLCGLSSRFTPSLPLLGIAGRHWRARTPRMETNPPFKAVLEGESRTFLASGEKRVLQLIMATHTGMTSDEFAVIVKDWSKTAQPQASTGHTRSVGISQCLSFCAISAGTHLQPISSGEGGVEFLRPWAQPVFGHNLFAEFHRSG
jgi:hypothetical protein